MEDFVVCSVFKDECHILEEWIVHYLYHGVDHFYLINDNSDDNYMDIIKKYSNHITLFHNDIPHDIPEGRQVIIYEKYLRNLLNKHTWFAILDMDEFLYSPREINIKKVIHKYNDFSLLLVDWLHFGSNDNTLQPTIVVENFTRRAKEKSFNHSTKYIFKGSQLKIFNIHNAVVDGDVVKFHNNDNKGTELIINRYNIQSKTFYLNTKRKRGILNNHVNNDYFTEQRFEEYDKNDIEDTRLYEQNKLYINKLKIRTFDIHANYENYKNNSVTITITSCYRPDLLDKTLESFIKYNTYPITETIILDDSGVINCNEEVIEKYRNILNIKSIYNKKNIRQLKTIDKLYSYVKTKYIFHCEEDWEFTKSSFIEKSLEIFERFPNEKIFTIWLRAHDDLNGHDYFYDNNGCLRLKELHNHWGVWKGISFNPGLRRTKDMYLYHPYSLNIENRKRHNNIMDEMSVNNLYEKDGYYSLLLNEKEGHVKHIGYDNSTNNSKYVIYN